MSLLNKSFVFLFCLLCGCSKQVVTTNETIEKKDRLKNECKSVVLCDPDHIAKKK